MANTEFTSPNTSTAVFGGDGVNTPNEEPVETPAAPVKDGPAESANILGLFTKEEQAKLVKTVLDDFNADLKSCSGRMKKLKEFTELYAALLKPKPFPWKGCANVNLNILSYTVLQVHARLYDMIWPENGKVIYSAPSTIDDFQRAAVTEKVANSRIRHKMPEMEQGLDDTLAQLTVYGSAFRRTFWDMFENRERSDWTPIEDCVVAHEHRSQDPSMRDVPRYTIVDHPCLWELEMHADRGVYLNVKGIRAEDADEKTDSELHDLVQKVDGVQPSSDGSNEDKPRMVLLQYRVWRMPRRPGKHPAFDGKPHFVRVTVDKQSERALHMVLLEEDDPEDVVRYEKEKQASGYNEAQILLKNYPQSVAAAQAAGLPPPAAPPVVPEPVKPRKRQISEITHYRAFPSEGFYGLGFGDFIGPMNKAANALINQHIDGVTIRNSRPGFISRQMRMQRGAVETAPGKLVEVDAPAAAIREGIVWMDPPLNDPTTMPLVNLLIQMADKFAGSSDIMSGSTSGANRTAKEIQILNAQLMKQISVLAKRVRGAQKHEFDKLWRLWGTFLPDDPEPMDVIDPLTGAPERIPVSRKMFVPDARVFPAADPRMRFEKVEEAMQKFGLVAQNPMLMQNPMVMRAVTEDVLKAHDAERLIAFLPPMQGPPPPPQPKPTYAEESGWMRDEDSPVHPADDDMQHVQDHMRYLASGPAQMMGKPGREMAEKHIRHHQAQLWEKLNTQQGPGGPPMMGPPGPPQGGPPLGAP